VAVYNLRSPDEDLERIKKVTVADVNRVARLYLDIDHAVTAVLVPRGAGRPVASGGFGGRGKHCARRSAGHQTPRLGRERIEPPDSAFFRRASNRLRRCPMA
jgi:zinc protease